MFAESELKPISALQHLVFCERRCALIHLEGVWEDNDFTVEGELLHERVHVLDESRAGEVRRVTAMPVRSLRLGLIGQCDLVEFSIGRPGGAEVPFPVEFKRGSQRRGLCDEVQLCAQALCLEEMLGCEVPRGAVFYAAIRRRMDIEFTPQLRERTEQAARRLHRLLDGNETPLVKLEPKCRCCSLRDHCLAQSKRSAIARYVEDLFHPGS